MKGEFLNNGIRLRWLNTAGFEIEMSNGKHILLDPFLNADIQGIPCWPISVDEIQRCDYGIMFIGFAAAGYFGPTIMRNVYASYGIYQPAFQIACGLNLAGVLLAGLYRMMNKSKKSTIPYKNKRKVYENLCN